MPKDTRANPMAIFTSKRMPGMPISSLTLFLNRYIELLKCVIMPIKGAWFVFILSGREYFGKVNGEAF
jgi:hypothetical protein